MTDYVPHTDAERQQMLATIGVDSMDALFDAIPGDERWPALDLPPPSTESTLKQILSALAHKNRAVESSRRFLGAGTYFHHVPAVVDDVLRRGEFYTSYTPYQPELSQGFLQATFEYQSMICNLTGMDVSNASHYDGATSLAEAALMALRLNEKDDNRRQIFVASPINPNFRAVTATYLRGTSATLVGGALVTESRQQFRELIGNNTAAVVVQQPDFFGAFDDLQSIAELTHAAGALLIVITDPIALGLFKPPGEYGADIVVGDGQCLGLPPMFGGPGLGIFATRKKLARQMAGRLVGETVDSRGERCYVLTLATREQHIRRARATSNICTNSALCALAAAVYLASVGRQGLRDLAELCYQRAHYAAHALAKLPSISINPWFEQQAFFREFVIELPLPADDINQTLLHDFGIVGGFDLSLAYPELTHHMLLAVTDVNTKTSIDALVSALRSITAR